MNNFKSELVSYITIWLPELVGTIHFYLASKASILFFEF